jgi:POT family proton-dependent oligopeptide transporter
MNVIAEESWKSRLAHIPEGTAALFFIQIFATLGFAVLYSTLVLYATRHLHFSAKDAAALIYLTIRHPHASERKRMWAYLILTLGSLVFWSLYQMAPNGLQLFAVHNVRLRVWRIEVAPQWVQNINTVVIVLGGPLLVTLTRAASMAKVHAALQSSRPFSLSA